jgi:hypothetical protein
MSDDYISADKDRTIKVALFILEEIKQERDALKEKAIQREMTRRFFRAKTREDAIKRLSNVDCLNPRINYRWHKWRLECDALEILNACLYTGAQSILMTAESASWFHRAEQRMQPS